MFQDWKANKGNIKAQLVLVFFRFAHILATNGPILFILGLPVLIFYRITVEWFLCIEIPPSTKIGKSLKLYHGQALVVNNETIIGDNCTLRQSTTIGTSKQHPDGSWGKSPVIGNNVDIGANSVLLGQITIGDNVIIGAGAVVVKDIKSNCVVAGNPAKVIKSRILEPIEKTVVI